MADITLITATPYVDGPEISYTRLVGLIAVSESNYIYARIRIKNQIKTFRWTAKGAQGDRGIPSADQVAPGSGWYLDGKGFIPANGSETSSLPDGSIYGEYWERWVNKVSAEYYDDDTEAWIEIT